MKLKVAGQIKDYRSSPVLGNTLTLSVSDDIADQLDKIGSKPVTIQIKTIDSENGNKYTIEYYNFDGMVLADSGKYDKQLNEYGLTTID